MLKCFKGADVCWMGVVGGASGGRGVMGVESTHPVLWLSQRRLLHVRLRAIHASRELVRLEAVEHGLSRFSL